ncbi:type II secretion system protein GspL [Allosphingosinicella deserti]|nr:type II secretion system protein GspL [Sphingomonas deserti]
MPISAAQSSDAADRLAGAPLVRSRGGPGSDAPSIDAPSTDRPGSDGARLTPRVIAFVEANGIGRFAAIDEAGTFSPVARPDDIRDCIVVVPADQVALHWVELPDGLAPAQALAAARLMVAELSAEPIAAMHVALGARSETGATCVALVSAATMAHWLSLLAQNGVSARSIVPETALLPAPADGLVRFDAGATALCRGPDEAFALEAPIAALVLGNRPVRALTQAEWEGGIASALSAPLVDLRQGPFARRRMHVERGFVQRAALLVFAILAVTIAAQLVAAYRDSAASGRMEAEARSIASAALPRGRSVVDPPAQLKARLAELGGGAGGFSAEASMLFAALRETPQASLAGLGYRDGALSVTIGADAPATLATLRTRIQAAGYAIAGPPPKRNETGIEVQWLVRPQ